MSRLLQFVLLLGAIFFIADASQAQRMSGFKKHRYSSFGIAINAMNYVGEVDPGPSFLSPGIKFTRENLALTYTRRLLPRYSVRGAVSWGRLKGSDFENAGYSNKDISRKFRNLSFRNDILEIKADIVIDFFENRGRYTKRPDYTPYGFIGIAYFHHNPKALYNGNWVALQPLHTEGKNYSLNQVALPVGLGFRYKINKQWDLAFEMGWRFTLTDYLDDISTTYADKSTLGSQAAKDLSDRTGELAGRRDIDPYVAQRGLYYVNDPYNSTTTRINGYGGKGDKRGDSNRDWYIVTGFHLTYILPGRVICPKFRTLNEDMQKKILARLDE